MVILYAISNNCKDCRSVNKFIKYPVYIIEHSSMQKLKYPIEFLVEDSLRLNFRDYLGSLLSVPNCCHSSGCHSDAVVIGRGQVED